MRMKKNICAILACAMIFGAFSTFVNGLMTETRATKHERKPGRWHPSRLSLCWNFANLLGYGHYTTPIVVYASGE